MKKILEKLFAGLNIRQKIIAFTALIFLIFLVVLGLIFNSTVTEQSKKRLHEQTADDAAQLDASLRSCLNFMGADLKELGGEYDLRQGGLLTIYSEQTADENGVVPMLPEQKGGYEYVLWLRFRHFVKTHDPWVYALTYGAHDGGYVQYPAADREAGYDPRRLYWYQEVMKQPDQLFIGAPFRSPEGRALIGVYAPVNDFDGNKTGVLGIQADLNVLLKNLGAPADFLLLDADGIIVAAPARQDLLFRPITEAELGDLSLLKSKEDDFRRIIINDEEKYACLYTSPDSHYRYIFLLDPATVSANSGNLRLILLALILLCLGITVWASRYLSDLITAPFKGLENAAEAIGEGDLRAAEKLKEHDDEVGRLSTAFQEMSERLQEKLLPLKANAENLENTASHIAQTGENLAKETNEMQSSALQMEQTEKKNQQTVGEIAANIKNLADNLQSIAQICQEIKQITEQIKKLPPPKLSTELSKSPTTDNVNIAEFTAAAKSIAKNLAELTDKAEQINLLALNAAVEAARHNHKEKSKFTAVAEDIRKLAETSAQVAGNAAQEMSELAKAAEKHGQKEQSVDHGQEAETAYADHLTAVTEQTEKINRLLDSAAPKITAVNGSHKLLEDAVLQIEWENRKSGETMQNIKKRLQTQKEDLQKLAQNAADLRNKAQNMKNDIDTFVITHPTGK